METLKTTVDSLENIDLSGFQIVGSDYFTVLTKPNITIWEDGIGFSTSAIKMLNSCSHVSILVNKDTRCILVKPVSPNDKDAVEWKSSSGNGRKISCTRFARNLFFNWGWDTHYHYRTQGRQVVADKKPMLLFDLRAPDMYSGQRKVN